MRMRIKFVIFFFLAMFYLFKPTSLFAQENICQVKSVTRDTTEAVTWAKDETRIVNKKDSNGVYDLYIADFVVSSDGIPSLQNIQKITPSGAR